VRVSRGFRDKYRVRDTLFTDRSCNYCDSGMSKQNENGWMGVRHLLTDQLLWQTLVVENARMGK
jgi:hypothetical protein